MASVSAATGRSGAACPEPVEGSKERKSASKAASDAVGAGRFLGRVALVTLRRVFEVKGDFFVTLLQGGIVQTSLLGVERIDQLFARREWFFHRDGALRIAPLAIAWRRTGRNRSGRFGLLTALASRGHDILTRDAAAVLQRGGLGARPCGYAPILRETGMPAFRSGLQLAFAVA